MSKKHSSKIQHIPAVASSFCKTFVPSTFIALLSVVAVSATADDNLYEKKAVYQQIKNYAQSIACDTTFDNDAEYKTTLEDVYLTNTDIDFMSGEPINSQYVVYWSGDWGCNGGTGTYSAFLSEVSRSTSSKPFLVKRHDILDDINIDEAVINARFIEEVDSKNGVLVITGSNFSESGSDLNNFPKNRYRYTVDFDENSYQWKLVNKRFIGTNKY